MIIADTGFWVALANRTDQHHEQAMNQMRKLTEPLITTWPVMTETCHLLLKRQGVQAEIGFIRSYRDGAFSVFDVRENDRDRILSLMQQYTDLPMDLADASLVVLAEFLGHGRILSTDRRDFRTYRWKNRHPFQNLLLES